jgi:uncharacterized integral membrane protein (TIGR00698 family)
LSLVRESRGLIWSHWRHWLFLALAGATLTPFVPAGLALVAGIVAAMTFGNPFLHRTAKVAPKLLAISVVGLGGTMNLLTVAAVGLHGLGYTAVGIFGTLALGWAVGRALKIDRDTSLLVASGTAICGGSAIAAVAVAIRAKPSEVSVALATVFLLNAVAILIFPPIGHAVGLSEHQFGLWSALAIHDTSSVVGAAMQYGSEALQVGTTVKLARALWIIPVSMGIAALRARSGKGDGDAGGKAKRPWFIVGFLTMAAVVTWIPVLQPLGMEAAAVAKRLLVLTLFLIGAGLTKERLRAVGFRPFVQGVLLWLVMGSLTLGAILAGWIY